MVKILDGWKVVYGGSRQGASVTIEGTEGRISGDVIGWLNANQKPCTRAKAAYCMIKRLSPSSEFPEEVAVPVKTDHRGLLS